MSPKISFKVDFKFMYSINTNYKSGMRPPGTVLFTVDKYTSSNLS